MTTCGHPSKPIRRERQRQPSWRGFARSRSQQPLNPHLRPRGVIRRLPPSDPSFPERQGPKAQNHPRQRSVDLLVDRRRGRMPRRMETKRKILECLYINRLGGGHVSPVLKHGCFTSSETW